MAFLVSRFVASMLEQWALARGDDSVRGALDALGRTKLGEYTTFYLTVLLAPLLVLVARRCMAGIGSLRWSATSGSALAAGGLVATIVAAWDVVRGDGSVLQRGLAVLLASGCLTVSACVARAADRGTDSIGRVARWIESNRIVWIAGSLTILTLAVGPRIDREVGIERVTLRAALVFTGAILCAAAVAAALRNPRRVLAAAQLGLAGLLVVRVAPQSLFAWSIAVVLGLGLAAFGWRKASPEPHRGSAGLLVAACVFAITFEPDPSGSIDFFHAGEWLVPGSEALDGAVPYRDLYLQHGLIYNALRAEWTFLALGRTLLADRFANALLIAATHAALALFLCQVLRSRVLAFAVAVLLATPGLWFGTRLLPLIGVLAALAFDLNRSRDANGVALARASSLPLALGGAFAGLGVFYSLDTGVFATLTMLLAVGIDAASRRGAPWLERLRPIGAVLLGLAVGAAPFVGWLAANDASRAFFANSIDQLRFHTAVWGLPHPGVSEVGRALRTSIRSAVSDGALTSLVAAGTWIGAAVVLAIAAFQRRFSRACWHGLVLTLAGALVYRTALGRSDAGHFAVAAALAWAALALAGERWFASAPRGRRFVRLATFAIVLAWWVAGFTPLYSAAMHVRALSTVPQSHSGNGFSAVPLPRARGVLLPDVQAQALVSCAAFIDESLEPDETFFDYSNMGAVYFVLGRHCPTRFVQPIYAATPAAQEQLIADLERAAPPILIVSNVLGSPIVDGIRLDERQPLVKRYLESRYAFEADLAFGLVYRRASR